MISARVLLFSVLLACTLSFVAPSVIINYRWSNLAFYASDLTVRSLVYPATYDPSNPTAAQNWTYDPTTGYIYLAAAPNLVLGASDRAAAVTTSTISFSFNLKLVDRTVDSDIIHTWTAVLYADDRFYLANKRFPGHVITTSSDTSTPLNAAPQVTAEFSQLYYFSPALSICDKYTYALGLTGHTLVETVVNATLLGAQNSVTPVDLLRYFDGSYVPHLPSFITNLGARSGLVQHLDQFFQIALGCSDAGNYTGQSLLNAHKSLPIGIREFQQFVDILLGVMAGAGVLPADLAAVNGVLFSTQGIICNQPDCGVVAANASICDRYASALNLTDQDLVSVVITAVLANLTTANSPLVYFFNGSIAGEPNFVTNATAYGSLYAHLVEFFGSALKCTPTNYPAYAGRSLGAVHLHLGINAAQFAYFNQVVIDVMASAGVSAADLSSVLTILQSVQGAIVEAS